MQNELGQALASFELALQQMRSALETRPVLSERVFSGTEEWTALLTYKLVPHLAGEGCLIAAVTGGTNTGKSTVFNLLTHQKISPMVNTAAATCHPVIAANAKRAAECLGGKLIPEFTPVPLENEADVINSDIDFKTLFVAVDDTLPDHLIIMDTPDVDSIDKRNWEVADNIRAAGDVLIAVITGEKYKDDRVVQYFRHAVDSGRQLVPVMNKANPADNFQVGRNQVEDFLNDVGIEAMSYVIPHDFSTGEDLNQSIVSFQDGKELRAHLESLDVPAIKHQVFAQTVKRFAETTSSFLNHLDEVHTELRDVADQFESLNASASLEYDPAPGKEVGGLFHAFVQSKRGAIRRGIGATSAAIVRGVSAIGRGIVSGVKKRTQMEAQSEETEASVLEFHRAAITRIAQHLSRTYIEISRNAPEPVASLIRKSVESLDVDAAVDAVIEDCLSAESISEEFREHADVMLNAWWEDHKGKRLTLEALDTILAIMPAAIAGTTGLLTSGFGAGELALASTAAGATFGAKVMEYQFGDALFDFLSPWKKDQQVLLKAALATHITEPCLHELYEALEPFEGEIVESLRSHHRQCVVSQGSIES